MEHAFNTNIATQYNVNIALLLQYFKYYSEKPQQNPTHIHDGLYWIRINIREINNLFPYWSKRCIQNILNKAIESCLLVKGKYNQDKFDQTTWYALTAKANNLFGAVDE